MPRPEIQNCSVISIFDENRNTLELLIIFILTLLNGFFALSEIALVSVKKARIDHLAAQGNKSAKAIQELLLNPENFLSSVQVGITLIGVIACADGGALKLWKHEVRGSGHGWRAH